MHERERQRKGMKSKKKKKIIKANMAGIKDVAKRA